MGSSQCVPVPEPSLLLSFPPPPLNVAHKLFNTSPLVAIKNENKKKNQLIGGKCWATLCAPLSVCLSLCLHLSAVAVAASVSELHLYLYLLDTLGCLSSLHFACFGGTASFVCVTLLDS